MAEVPWRYSQDKQSLHVHMTRLLMLLIICAKCGKIPIRTARTIEQARQGLWNGQGQSHFTHALMFVIIVPNMGENNTNMIDVAIIGTMLPKSVMFQAKSLSSRGNFVVAALGSGTIPTRTIPTRTIPTRPLPTRTPRTLPTRKLPTHCGLVTQYGYNNLGQHWLR